MLPEGFKEWALKELREVRHAPAAFAILSALCVGLGWWAAKTFYSERIEVMQLQIGALERSLPVFRDSPTPTLTPNRALIVALAFVVVVCIPSVASALRNKRVVGEAEEDLRRRSSELTRVINERDKVAQELKDKKYEYAMDTLSRYAHLGVNGKKPRVTVRYSDYGQDYETAQKIKGMFTQYVKWPVTLEISNTLPRAEKFKVVFDVGMTAITYNELVHAFSEGDLVNATVGIRQFTERDDIEQLIVLVLPSAPSA
jgi:hypothetical protein